MGRYKTLYCKACPTQQQIRILYTEFVKDYKSKNRLFKCGSCKQKARNRNMRKQGRIPEPMKHESINQIQNEEAQWQDFFDSL